ncbi:hypothetical protein F4778DRAFT_778650 [Xylariomycetidae sp. FL2044]|nr:hypothetical protein F4778DRAFT_778650 [Xylariomycetidae sp. FL2044]
MACMVTMPLGVRLMIPRGARTHLADDARVVVISSTTHDPAQKTPLPDATYTSAKDMAYPPPAMVHVKGIQRYSSTKLCNVLWTYALARRLQAQAEARDPGRQRRAITVNAFDPGIMPQTGLTREAAWWMRFINNHVLPRVMFILRRVLTPNIHPTRESAAVLARLAVGADLAGVTGRYFEGQGYGDEIEPVAIASSKDSYVESKQEDLWRWTVDYLCKGDEAEKARWEALE